MQSDDLIGKLLSQSLTRSDERKPSFLLSCYSTSSCGYSNFMWVQNHLDKFTIENSIKGYLEEKKIHFRLGKTLSHKLLEAGEIPWENSTREVALAVCPWADIIDGLSRHAAGLNRPVVLLSTVSFMFSFPPFLVIVIQTQIIILNLVFLTQKANNNLVSILSKR